MSAVMQQTPEWREMRKTKIGASDAPIIMGVSPWKTPYQLWEEKLGIADPSSVTYAQQRGLDMEEAARRSFEAKTGLIMLPQVVIHPNIDWMMASLDGMDLEHQNVVEIKCAGKDDHSMAVDGKVPPKYMPQLQHQLEVTGLDMLYYYSFDGEDGVIVEVKRNSRYIRRLVEREEEFYRCMKSFVPPELTDKDYAHKDDDIWRETAKEWYEVNRQITELDRKSKELRDALVSMSHGRSSRGGGVRVCKSVRKGAIDYASIPFLRGVEMEQYRKPPVEVWTITRDRG